MRWLDGITDAMHKFEQAPGVGDGLANLVSADYGVTKSWT